MDSALPVDPDHNRTGAGVPVVFAGDACTGTMKINRIMPSMSEVIFRRFFMVVPSLHCIDGKIFPVFTPDYSRQS